MTTCNNVGLSKSQTAPGHAVILIRKKNRDVCFYIAYRKLNDVMKKNCFPLP